MAQDSTQAFSRRLIQAVESCPLAPPTPHGRQRWLLTRLEKEAGLSVSPNSVHKWFGGTAKPREDNIRKIAKVLQVDEVWLSMGRRPVAEARVQREDAARASGAALLLAGLLELRGHRVSFAGEADEGVSLWVNVGARRIGLTVVVPIGKGDEYSYIVPEPVGDNRIVAVSTRNPDCAHAATECVDILDLTDAPRENQGGFSVIRAQPRGHGRVKVVGLRNLLSPAPGAEALVS